MVGADDHDEDHPRQLLLYTRNRSCVGGSNVKELEFEIESFDQPHAPRARDPWRYHLHLPKR